MLSFSRFKIVIYVYLLLFIFFMVGCSGNGDTWESTLMKQQKAKGSVPRIDSFVVRFMTQYHIPGMSVAIEKNGKILCAKGYGYSDKAKKQEVTTESLFRVGDISSTITSMAIMKLIEAGKLSITSKVFGDSGILKNDYGTPPYSKGITNITIDHLLHHTSGGWSDGDDPIFLPALRNASVDRAKLLSATLDHVPLRSLPGQSFAYSRFGYFVLGMVIEKVSGQSYEDFVLQNVIRPAGIDAMRITADNESDKKKNEVICYKEDTNIPFSYDEIDDDFFLSRAAACSGWLASAKDLVKLIATDNLDSNTKEIMFTASKLNPHYACGWSSNSDFKNWFCISQIPGSTAEFVRAGNGYRWAVLINTYRPVAGSYISDLDNLVWKVLEDSLVFRKMPN